MTKVLIIEDDTIFGEMLSLYLAGENYEVRHVETAQAGMDAVANDPPDVILLDLLLPDGDGTELAGVIRQRTQAPIIIVSMNSSVGDKIRALTAGADDYLSKPFSMQELKARIETILRRVRQTVPVLPAGAAEETPAERIRIDQDRRTIIVDGRQVETTYSGFEIMKLFCQFPGKVFSRDELINALRGIDSFVNERAIDVHITNLRKKIEANPKEPRHIKTVWGVGYKFMP